MLENFFKLRRAMQSSLRSLRASIHGPEQGSEKVKRVLSSFRAPLQSTLQENKIGYARLSFKKQAFNRMKHAITLAKTSIEIQMFIWIADTTGREVAELLVDAANRDVKVTIQKEIIGDAFEFGDDFLATKDEQHPVWQAFWNHPQITVHHTNHHDHSKTFVIDDNVLLVSSMNIGDAYCNNWHECLVELHGQRFVESYRKGSAEPPQLTKNGQIEIIRSSSKHPMLPVVLSLITGAKRSIRIEMAYFSDPQIVELLAKKTHEGIYVFLILPHSPDIHHHANLGAAAKLLALSRRHHAFVFRYPRGLLHTKMIIIDRKTLFIGSTNFVTSSLVKLGETNVLIHRNPKNCLRLARRIFAEDALQSVQVEVKELTRSYWQKFLSWLSL